MSETEREDLEESEKIQYWVERLCQTRLEQISSAENEIPEVTHLPSMGATMDFAKALPWGPKSRQSAPPTGLL